MYRYLILVALVGCASSAPPASEPLKGEPGEMGPAGASLRVVQIDGGVLVIDSDGGSAILFNGETGPRGLQGLQGEIGLQGIAGPVGPVGPQGAPGATPSGMVVYGADGGELGTPIFNYGNDNNVDLVFLKGSDCLAALDWNSSDGGIIQPSIGNILYEGPNCTGTAFVLRTNRHWPLGCYSDWSGMVFRATKPAQLRIRTSQSFMTKSYAGNPPVQIGVICVSRTETGLSAAVEEVTLPQNDMTLSFGTR